MPKATKQKSTSRNTHAFEIPRTAKQKKHEDALATAEALPSLEQQLAAIGCSHLDLRIFVPPSDLVQNENFESKPGGKVPRPSNCWMLFRAHMKNQLLRHTNQQDLSGIVSDLWAKLYGSLEHSLWESEAEKVAKKHRRLFPSYSYAQELAKGKFVKVAKEAAAKARANEKKAKETAMAARRAARLASSSAAAGSASQVPMQDDVNQVPTPYAYHSAEAASPTDSYQTSTSPAPSPTTSQDYDNSISVSSPFYPADDQIFGNPAPLPQVTRQWYPPTEAQELLDYYFDFQAASSAASETLGSTNFGFDGQSFGPYSDYPGAMPGFAAGEDELAFAQGPPDGTTDVLDLGIFREDGTLNIELITARYNFTLLNNSSSSHSDYSYSSS